MNIILIGPQGSGKGVQSKLLAEHFKIPTLSVGQLFRKEIKNKTALGKKAASYVLKGKLVPIDLAEKLLKKELAKKIYSHGVIFDGFPRNFEQNSYLEKIRTVDYAILIDISHKEILKRLSGRFICDCGQTYNIYSLKSERPKHHLTCDKCGHKLKQRADDTPKAIKQRLKIYQNETKPLIKYYRQQKKLLTISGEQKIDQVFKAILLALKQKGFKP
jgi:adenylate kinase